MKLKEDRRGSALIVVMCVMLVTVALSLTLLLTASILMTNAIRSADKEQCRITAVSVSDLMIEEIEKIEYNGSDGNPVAPYRGAADSGTLAGKLQTVTTDAWYDYDPNEGELGQLQKRDKNRFVYTLQDDKLPGVTQVELYWVDDTGYELDTIKESDLDSDQKFMNDLTLYMRVTNTAGRESSTIVSVFRADVTASTVEENGQQVRKWTEGRWLYDRRDWERRES